jgi:hypothetical protein
MNLVGHAPILGRLTWENAEGVQRDTHRSLVVKPWKTQTQPCFSFSIPIPLSVWIHKKGNYNVISVSHGLLLLLKIHFKQIKDFVHYCQNLLVCFKKCKHFCDLNPPFSLSQKLTRSKSTPGVEGSPPRNRLSKEKAGRELKYVLLIVRMMLLQVKW